MRKNGIEILNGAEFVMKAEYRHCRFEAKEIVSKVMKSNDIAVIINDSIMGYYILVVYKIDDKTVVFRGATLDNQIEARRHLDFNTFPKFRTNFMSMHQYYEDDIEKIDNIEYFHHTIPNLNTTALVYSLSEDYAFQINKSRTLMEEIATKTVCDIITMDDNIDNIISKAIVAHAQMSILRNNNVDLELKQKQKSNDRLIKLREMTSSIMPSLERPRRKAKYTKDENSTYGNNEPKSSTELLEKILWELNKLNNNISVLIKMQKGGK